MGCLLVSASISSHILYLSNMVMCYIFDHYYYIRFHYIRYIAIHPPIGMITSNHAHKTNNKNIGVAVRMRPLLHLFEDQEVWEINHDSNKITSAIYPTTLLAENININNSSQTLKHKKKNTLGSAVERSNRYQFVYDHAFGPAHTNKEIYDQCCHEIINQFSHRGRNGTIFMYGQTTSGKTFTMLGDQHVSGLIEYSLKDICNQLLARDDVHLCITYLEIYNEQINDLLSPGSINLKVIDDKVHGAKQCQINSYQEALNLLELGEEQRSYSEKKYHDHSSRSHTIFQIKRVQGKSKAILNLVDLAGSQRLTDEQTNQQTGFINKSLFVLSNVIHRLASGKKNVHVPYRDSKLTRLLAPSLSGQSMTIVICTVSPASVNFYQTLSTLRFAACSRKVQLKPFSNSPQLSKQQSFSLTESKQLAKLRQQNQKLKKDVSNLSFIRQSQQNYLDCRVKQIGDSLRKQSIKLEEGWEQKLDMLCKQYRKNIQTLQKEYTKALINAVSVECQVDRQRLASILKDA